MTTTTKRPVYELPFTHLAQTKRAKGHTVTYCTATNHPQGPRLGHTPKDVLAYIAAHPGCVGMDIVRDLYISHSVVCAITRRLAADGYITRGCKTKTGIPLTATPEDVI